MDITNGIFIAVAVIFVGFVWFLIREHRRTTNKNTIKYVSIQQDKLNANE